MIESKTQRLEEYLTIKIGGPAPMCFPENREQWIQTVQEFRELGTAYRLLANGSNIIASERPHHTAVIKVPKDADRLEIQPNGEIYADSGVLFRNFVKFLVANGYYGHENLSSVPGTIGGGIFMNAGRGPESNAFLGNHVVSVEALHGTEIVTLTAEQCEFDYRSSLFSRNPDYTILGATFRLPEQPTEIGKQRIKERAEFVRGLQEFSLPNAGSIFSHCHPALMARIRGLRFGQARWSKKTPNWIVNLGGARLWHVEMLIRIVRLLHIAYRMQPRIEVRIWK